MKKGISLLLIVVMLAGVFTACGKAETAVAEPVATAEPTAEPEPVDEPHDDVTLTVWHYAIPGVDEGYQLWADRVHEAYPWISLEFEVLPFDSGPEKFTVACATGTTPDIYFDGFSRIAPAVDAGMTINLTSLVEKYKNIFSGTQADGIINGENRYIAVSDGAPYCLVVNMTLAKKLGVDSLLPADHEIWSYEEFLKLCRAVKAADNSVYPLSLYAGSQSGDAWYYSWLLGNGSKVTNSDLTATDFNSAENHGKTVQVFELLKTLIDEELVPAGCASMVDNDCKEFWYAGNMLFMPTAYNMVSNFYQLMQSGDCPEYEMDAIALPTYEGKVAPTTASWGSTGFCAFSNNGNEEAILLALDIYLKDAEPRTMILQAAGSLPTLNDITIEFATPEITEIMMRGADYGARCADSSFGIRESWWSDFRGTFYVQLQDYFTGNIDLETMLSNWQTNGDMVIAEALAAKK